MSIKKLPRKRSRVSSNLIVRMSEDRMGSDKMSDERGPGSIGRIQRPSFPSTGQSNAAKNKKTEQKS
jgi:hypothetical protein